MNNCLASFFVICLIFLMSCKVTENNDKSANLIRNTEVFSSDQEKNEVLKGHAASDEDKDINTGEPFNGSCINPNLVAANRHCSKKAAPVCGCNNVTYTNQCEAEKAGVLRTKKGSCKTKTAVGNKKTAVR